MFRCEQQINNNLSQFEEQQELNHIRWLLNNQTKRSFYLDKNQYDGYSEWINNTPDHSSHKDKIKYRYFKSKRKDQGKRYAYFIEPMNDEESTQFQKYSKMPTYVIKKQKSPGTYSPKKVTLKLPFPQGLEQAASCSEIKGLQQNVLPTIKRTTFNFLRKQDNIREKSMDEITRYPLLFRQQSQNTEKQGEEVIIKGKMMGSTRRQFKNYSSSCTKPEDNTKRNKRLQQCLTFIK